MIPLTRQDVFGHQAEVPWSVPYQVEQDLLLCRAMVTLFNDLFLREQIAMCGGTVLHKVHLPSASRTLSIVVVTNVTERQPHKSVVELPFTEPFQEEHWQRGFVPLTFTRCWKQRCVRYSSAAAGGTSSTCTGR